ncbi:MAG: hypothetical protein M9944_05890 [Rhizobiaceae bacterium]|nr:hypothetical protein [Rhizobiaceae bacterium]MCO5070728.1 hypothetical protein [Rhizobiaceae bacterium]
MKRAAVAFALILLAGCQSAVPEMSERRASTVPSVPTLSGSTLQAFIVGNSLRYSHYGAVSSFFSDGRYGYRDYEVRDGGTYTISGDMVCINFDDGGRRCDRYAKVGDDYVRIEEGGRQTKIEGTGPA